MSRQDNSTKQILLATYSGSKTITQPEFGLQTNPAARTKRRATAQKPARKKLSAYGPNICRYPEKQPRRRTG